MNAQNMRACIEVLASEQELEVADGWYHDVRLVVVSEWLQCNPVTYQVLGLAFPEAKLLNTGNYLSPVLELSSSPAKELAARKLEPMKDFLIAELNFGVRVYNLLVRRGIETIGMLAAMSPPELLGIPTFGKRCLKEVQEAMQAQGLQLREDD